MSPQIDVDEEVLEALKGHAEPFVDTPNSVLRRLLAVDRQSRAGKEPAIARQAQTPRPKQSTKRPIKPTRSAPRAAPGSLLPEERYELPLLNALVDLGGQAPYRHVVEAVGKQLEQELMPLDKEKLASGGIRWRSRLQFVRLRLIERGLMARETPRGVWAVTEDGRTAATEGRTR